MQLKFFVIIGFGVFIALASIIGVARGATGPGGSAILPLLGGFGLGGVLVATGLFLLKRTR